MAVYFIYLFLAECGFRLVNNTECHAHMYKNYKLIETFRNMLIQIHSNLLKNYFPQNIIHTKYNTFTVIPLFYLASKVNLSFISGCTILKKKCMFTNKIIIEYSGICVIGILSLKKFYASILQWSIYNMLIIIKCIKGVQIINMLYVSKKIDFNC